jgi:hypothetical protein
VKEISDVQEEKKIHYSQPSQSFQQSNYSSPLKDPKLILKFDKQINLQNKNNLDQDKKYLGGSSFNYMHPSTGVTVLEDGKQKKGTENYYDKFGKMSKYDYEKLKKQYNSDNSETQNKQNKNNFDIYNANVHNQDLNLVKIAQREILNNISKEEKIIKGPIIKSDFTKLKNTLDPPNITNIPNIQSRNPSLSNQSSVNIFNENIFKNRKVSDMKKKRKESNDFKEMNNFNLNLINNNWGSRGIENNYSSSLGEGKISTYYNNAPMKPILSNRIKDPGLSLSNKIPGQRIKGQSDIKNL